MILSLDRKYESNSCPFKKKIKLGKGAFIYDVRFLGRQVGQAASDFTT